MQYSFTRESQVRAAFWQGFPNRPKKLKSGDYPTDIRCEFVDFVDMLAHPDDWKIANALDRAINRLEALS